MISREGIKYSLRNLKQSKARSFLTILSIFVGITTIFIFISFGLGLYNYIGDFTNSGSADKIVIQPKGGSGVGLSSTVGIDNSDIKAIESATGVFEVSGSYIEAAEVIKGDKKIYAFLISYDPDVPLMIEFSNFGVLKGRNLRSNDDGNVILGYNYYIDDKIFPKGFELNDKVEINGDKLKIIGFFEEVGNPQDDSNIYMTNDYAEDFFSDKNLSYGMVVARADVNNLDGTADNIEKDLRKHRNLEEGKEDFSIQSFSELLENYLGAMGIVIWFIVAIALMSVFVSAVNTANTMITSVLERYKEIGVLKAIGARNSEILGIFLFESAFLGFVAGIIGVSIGAGLSYMGGIVLDNLGWSFLAPHFSIALFVSCILFATLTGAISGIAPAIRASKTNTVDALRYE